MIILYDHDLRDYELKHCPKKKAYFLCYKNQALIRCNYNVRIFSDDKKTPLIMKIDFNHLLEVDNDTYLYIISQTLNILTIYLWYYKKKYETKHPFNKLYIIIKENLKHSLKFKSCILKTLHDLYKNNIKIHHNLKFSHLKENMYKQDFLLQNDYEYNLYDLNKLYRK